MSSLYRYTSTEERTYVDRALNVSPGDVIDWPDGPPADGHWAPVEETGPGDEKPKAVKKTPSAPAAPTIEE